MRIARVITGIPLSVLLSITLITSISFAGNKEMVEKDVRELDRLNKKAVSQLPDLPGNAEVEIEADIRYEKGEPDISILRKKIRKLNRPYSENSTRKQGNQETGAGKKPGLIKEGTNYEVER